MAQTTETDTRVFAYVEYLIGNPEYDDTVDGCLAGVHATLADAVQAFDGIGKSLVTRYTVLDGADERYAEVLGEWDYRSGWTFPETEED